jgi:dihydrolipoamide dehydrogenase
VAREMTAVLRKRGVEVITGAKVVADSVFKDEEGVRLAAESANGRREIKAEKALVAVGRVPNVEGIGLENTDVVIERGAIRVSEHMQTSENHIYAIGDVTGGMQMAHAASFQGIVAVEHICGVATRFFDAALVPRCIFSRPEIASIGMTEAEARAAGRRVKTAKTPFRINGKALVYGEKEGFAKLVADEESGDILGVHMIGAKVTEMIGEASLAKLLDASPWEIGMAIHPHPTLSETLMEVGLSVDGR